MQIDSDWMKIMIDKQVTAQNYRVRLTFSFPMIEKKSVIKS